VAFLGYSLVYSKLSPNFTFTMSTLLGSNH